MTLSFKLSLPYILGLLNTDGSFFVILKKDPTMKLGWRLLPTVQISLKEQHAPILYDILLFLKTSYNIIGKVKNKSSPRSSEKKNRQRAWALEITGLENVKKMLTCISCSTLENPLVGLKYYDFCLFSYMYKIIEDGRHNEEKGRKQILDIIRSLHIPPILPASLNQELEVYSFPPRSGNPIPPAYRKSQECLEQEHGFMSGSSKGSAYKHIFVAKALYIYQCRQSLRGLLCLHPSQISGMLDGDGCLHVKKDLSRNFYLCCGEGEEALLLSFAKYFGDKKPRFYKGFRNSVQYAAMRKQLLVSLDEHLISTPLYIKRFKTTLTFDEN